MSKRAVVATHWFSPGTSQAFYAYLQRHGYDALYIEHKLFGSPLSWSLDALDTYWQVIKSGKRYDFFMGSNRLNAFIGILLKWSGRVKKVIYFSPDWVEARHGNNLFNNLYQWLDYFCVKYSDKTWNSSAYMKVDPMMNERMKRNYPKEFLKKQIQVPDGTDPYPIPDWKEIDRNAIGFVGHIKEGMGLEMLIESFKEVIKDFPQTKLIIIGSGPILDKLKKQSKKLPIEFTGYMGDLTKVYKKLAHCAFAVAPYEQGTISQYTDPGKVKVYFSVGLPIIISHVPYISREIKTAKAGLVINDTQEGITEAIKTLLTSDEILKEQRIHVLKMAKKYSWDRLFDQALSASFKKNDIL